MWPDARMCQRPPDSASRSAAARRTAYEIINAILHLKVGAASVHASVEKQSTSKDELLYSLTRTQHKTRSTRIGRLLRPPNLLCVVGAGQRSSHGRHRVRVTAQTHGKGDRAQHAILDLT